MDDTTADDRSGTGTDPSAPEGTAASASGGSLRRTIGLSELVFFGLVFIGPAAAVGVFGTLDARSGGAVALVYIVATIVMAFTAISYMRMSRDVPAQARSSPTPRRASENQPASSPGG